MANLTDTVNALLHDSFGLIATTNINYQVMGGWDGSAIVPLALSSGGVMPVPTGAALETTQLLVQASLDIIDDAIYTDGAGTPSKGILIMGSDGTNPQAIKCNADGEFIINLETSDIEIGAVEIKNASTDDRVEVSDANTARATTSHVLSVQNIDALGDVPVWGDLTLIKTATESLNTKQGATGAAADVDGVRAGQLRYIGEANEASRVLLATIDADTGVIAGDTTSIDSKIIACNTGAVVVASGAITETNSGAIKTAVEKLDNVVTTISSTELNRVALFGDNDNQIKSFGGGVGGSGIMIGSEIGTYAFDASAKTITITGIANLDIEEILGVINITDQETIYDPKDTGKGGTISGNVITLEYDTTAMADADALQIYVQYNNSEDYSTNAKKTNDIAKAYKQNEVQHPIEETNKAIGTYRVEVNWDDVRHGSIHLKGSGGVTFTLWASNDSTADTTADTGWVDVSTNIMGAASLVDSEAIYFIDTFKEPLKFMIKYVTSDATNAIDAWVKTAN